MKRLLDIEFHKFKYSKSSKVLTIIYLVIVILLMFTGLIQVNINGFKGSLSDLGIFNFPYIWHLSTYMVSFLKIFIAIVIVSLTANEYSNRTLKQNLIDGLSKKELILSKLYLAITLALLTTMIVFIASLILGLFHSDYLEIGIIFSKMEYLPAFFISHLMFFCFCLFAGVLVKRSAFALGLIGVWWIFELVIRGLSSFIDFKYDVDTWNVIQHILPLESASLLIKEPFTKISIVQGGIEQLTQGQYIKDYGVSLINVVTSMAWSFLFIFWSYKILKRRDL
ncbi:ABC transporter permease [Nonlabens ulvanivorans]|uniref:ABC-type transport system involved in multi-copper enzyme maturation permease subunit n=3 Tax=Nonlabens ulvanivorans TaxID=906888 RepID=A0A084JWB6_NONUL|nr:ABC transporter permease [Nonlabens ulvanivorans]KEZ93250.1 excinuclease ABC subunit B [Nonlabens ulvanivorans]PRX13627.1 ABC-type transport system involved in multi-copper enzyme maturation permease subunit [Nonlabens ulvanivorans]